MRRPLHDTHQSAHPQAPIVARPRNRRWHRRPTAAAPASVEAAFSELRTAHGTSSAGEAARRPDQGPLPRRQSQELIEAGRSQKAWARARENREYTTEIRERDDEAAC